jgi:hypothetical protein
MADAHIPVKEAFAAWDADKYTLTTDRSSAITTDTKLCVRVTLSLTKDDAFEGAPAWLEQTLDSDISLGDLDAVIGTFLDGKGFVRKEAACGGFRELWTRSEPQDLAERAPNETLAKFSLHDFNTTSFTSLQGVDSDDEEETSDVFDSVSSVRGPSAIALMHSAELVGLKVCKAMKRAGRSSSNQAAVTFDAAVGVVVDILVEVVEKKAKHSRKRKADSSPSSALVQVGELVSTAACGSKLAVPKAGRLFEFHVPLPAMSKNEDGNFEVARNHDGSLFGLDWFLLQVCCCAGQVSRWVASPLCGRSSGCALCVDRFYSVCLTRTQMLRQPSASVRPGFIGELRE